jgi:spore maturation protein CgeB
MNIAFFGSSLLSAYWNGAATYYRGLIRALHARGHRTVFYEPDAFDRQQHRDLEPPAWARVMVYAGEHELQRALESAREADLVVKASGVGIFDDWLEHAVLQQRRSGQLVAFWDVDAPATLSRVEDQPQDAFRALIPKYDFIFTYGGGAPVVERYRALGARRCVPIYNAHDPETHFPATPVAKFAGDLGFLGNRLPDREERVDRFFFDAARLLPERHFVLGGNGWAAKPLPENVRYLGHVYTHEHNAFNASSLAVLNVNRASMAENGFSPATRVFEAAAAGACIISDAWQGIEHFLEPEREILVANGAEEVAERVRALNVMRSQEIGARARRRVLAEHTYAMRALEVERALSGSSMELAS